MWGFLVLCVVFGEKVTVFSHLNRVYEGLTGYKNEPYEVASVLYEDATSLVAVVHNNLTRDMELHYLKFYECEEGNCEVRSHTNPYFLKEIGENKELKILFGKTIRKHPKNMQTKELWSQTLEILPFNSTKILQFHMYKSLVLVQGSEYTVYMQTNSTGESEVYSFLVKTEENDERASNGLIFLLVLFTLFMSFLVSYLVIYIYWSRTKTFPFIKYSEERLHLRINLP